MILSLLDVHGDFRHILLVVQKLKPAATISLGDLELQRPLEEEIAELMRLTEVYFTYGNHDTDSEANHDFMFKSKLADGNLHNKVVEIDGHRVASLGGVFREKIWWPQLDASVEPKQVFDFPMKWLKIQP